MNTEVSYTVNSAADAIIGANHSSSYNGRGVPLSPWQPNMQEGEEACKVVVTKVGQGPATRHDRCL